MSPQAKPTPATSRHRILILGAGPAGYTAAIYAAHAGLRPLVITGLQPGGQLTIATEVENFPGFATAVDGPWLMEQMRAQAENVGAVIMHDTVVAVDLSRRPFRCTGDSGSVYESDALIIATGAQARWLGIPGEAELHGGGVSACATCDGFFYRGKDVVVVGGGNTAVEEALYLANLAASVILVHRRDSLRAERILQERLFARDNVTVQWNKVPDRVLCTDGPRPVVRGLAVRCSAAGTVSEIPADGVFVAIGHAPATAMLRGHVETDEDGYIVTQSGTTRTSIPGVFAAGDVQDRLYRQAVTAAGSGCMAALDAERFLAGTAPDTSTHATAEDLRIVVSA